MGRPKGSKNKPKPRKGRPKGSKNRILAQPLIQCKKCKVWMMTIEECGNCGQSR